MGAVPCQNLDPGSVSGAESLSAQLEIANCRLLFMTFNIIYFPKLETQSGLPPSNPLTHTYGSSNPRLRHFFWEFLKNYAASKRPITEACNFHSNSDGRNSIFEGRKRDRKGHGARPGRDRNQSFVFLLHVYNCFDPRLL